jgi:hypothetical protein
VVHQFTSDARRIKAAWLHQVGLYQLQTLGRTGKLLQETNG